ncbi:hypothetical protein KKJ09_12600 [Xenorhabdus bovienii]|uniref:hypothetical protein n=1 Tax=Xenorhabdus bovienii TaxID=40576 RepID=UPI0023B27BCC|nr:hypothetical protein [Xenorhabdus bovienii]MDE9494402.1 hypothetical protein [Xenorhabdus bovienii]MDE9502841.1 hypothetical protein [Xenorhabdus bovienii]MDE9526456.1 hypothetical protein [Xenorhabdus bovienii]
MWGFQTWDENGKPNNLGVIPFLIAGTITVPKGQTSFSYSYVLPDGYKLDYTIMDNGDDIIANLDDRTKYEIRVHGNTISARPSSLGIPSASEKKVLVFYRRG